VGYAWRRDLLTFHLVPHSRNAVKLAQKARISPRSALNNIETVQAEKSRANVKRIFAVLIVAVVAAVTRLLSFNVAFGLVIRCVIR
jgi:hypothetical protein